MKYNQGFVSKIVMVVIALIAIKYAFDFDIVEWYNSPSGQKYAGTIWNLIKDFYNWLDALVRGWVN